MDTSYEDDVKIDENRLDYEWDRQPSLMMKWSLKHAHAVKVLHQTEQNLKIVRAEAKTVIETLKGEIDLDIRNWPEDYGLKEVTDKSIIAAISRDKDFIEVQKQQQILIKEAVDKYIEAVEEEQVYGSAVKAMMARRKSLENLAALYMNNYHSEPKQPGYKEDRLNRAMRAGDEIREAYNKRRGHND